MEVRRLVGLAVLLVSVAPHLARAEKSSTRPNVISVPGGPGAISGLGEQFQPRLNTGSGSYTVPLVAPAATAGMAPSLSLAYDTGAGNGAIGLGWSLDVGSIQRATDEGVPTYGTADRFLFNGSEIVPLADGSYRLETEGRFLRFRRGATASHWEVDAPDGTVYRYGVSAGARIEDPAGRGIFRWALEQVIDLYGNRILYEYEADGGQLYLQRIRYNARAGAAQNEIVFSYEPRPDVLTDCRAGFCIKTSRRLATVEMFASGGKVRSYELSYAPGSTLSLLHTVRLLGVDGATALPPVTFEYTEFAPAGRSIAELPNAPAFALNNPNVELVDFNADSLPDLLHTQPGAHQVAINLGIMWAPATPIPASPAVQLSSNGVEIADIDADGIADLLARLAPTAGSFQFFLSDGTGTWSAPKAFTNNPPFSFEDPSVRMIDFDGDGRIDVMQTTSSNFYYWRNNGDGTWSAATVGTTISGEQILFSDAQVKLADMNGDRLVDLVKVDAAGMRYWANLGHGRWGAMIAMSGAPSVGADAPRLQIRDVNGDGLSDAVLVVGTEARFWIQKGSDRFADALVVTGLPEANPANTVVRLADINGSGSVDLVWNTPSSATPWRYLDLTGGVRPNLLRSITNGLGRTIRLEYRSSGELYLAASASGAPWSSRLPFPVQVVSAMSVEDGRGNTVRQEFSYRDGYYDGPTRQFRGFGEASRVEPGSAHQPGVVSTVKFNLGRTDEVLKGVTDQVEVKDLAGVLFTREVATHSVRTHAAGTDGRAVRSAERTRLDVWHFERTSTPVLTTETWSYDEFGNVLEHGEWGIVEGTNRNAADDERITSTEYVNDPQRWLLGRAFRVRVTDGAGKRLSETRSYFDGDPFVGLPLGELGTRGVRTRTEQWVEGTRFLQAERVKRDEFGNVVETLDARGTRRQMEFDPTTHRFVERERVFLSAERSLGFEASWDPVMGTISSFSDLAGRKTHFRYDALGRPTAIIRPGDAVDSPVLTFEYQQGNPLSAVITRMRADDLLTEKYEWQDGLGRKLGTVSTAEDGKTIVSGLVAFGSRGMVERRWDPFFSSGFALPAAQGPFTEHRYDELGRETVTLFQDGSRAEHRFMPFEQATWTPEDLDPASLHAGTPRVTRSNALGLTEIEERLNGSTVITRVVRDALGRIRQRVDAEGHVASFLYDGVGRLVESSHPARGTETLEYDDGGNLIRRKDARGARVEVDYDPLDRVLEERSFSASGALEETVRFHYDDPSPEFADEGPQPGGLMWIEDATGSHHFAFDERGRIRESIRILDGERYRFAEEYDALDRPVRTTYPNGTTYEYRYGPRGQVVGIDGHVRAAAYDARGLLTRLEYENGATTTWKFDDLGRLEGQRVEVTGSPIRDLSYGYNKDGALHTITDGLRSDGPLSATRSFSYDTLYRLTAAQSPAESWSYRFDKVGNLLFKSEVGNYEYENPHRATRIGGEPYSYDQAGNVLESPGARWSWDGRGRLAAVERDDGTRAKWRYGYPGSTASLEITSGKGNRSTLYVDERYEVRDGVPISYLFLAGKRVAEIRHPAGPGTSAAAGTLRAASRGLSALAFVLLLGAVSVAASGSRRRALRRRLAAASLATAMLASSCNCGEVPAEAVRYFHADHIGGISFQTDGAGTVLDEANYDPYGAVFGGAAGVWGFGGKEQIAELGISWFEARPYDPRLGRFLSVDPASASPDFGLDDPQLLSVYAYARNTASFFLDLLGLTGRDMGHEQMLRAKAAFEANTRLRDRPAADAQQAALVREANWARAYSQATWQEQAIYDISEVTGGNDMARAATGANEMAEELSLWDRIKIGVKGVATAAGWATTASSAGKMLLVKPSGAVPVSTAVRESTSRIVPQTAARTCPAGVCPCFVEGTPVVTAEGLRPIEEIREGDLVLSRSDETGETDWKRVTRTFVTPDKPYLELAFERDERDGTGAGQQLLNATEEHPFWVEGRGWVEAGDLVEGDRVPSANGGWLRVTSSTWAQQRVTVFNFEVEDFHTYFVGEEALWVHNTCAAGTAGQKTVIGKVKDLQTLRPGENTLLKHLPDQGNPKANWAQNSGVLRQEMAKGLPLRDASVDSKTGELIEYPGSFLNAERNLLRDRGWTYDPATTLWSPPKK